MPATPTPRLCFGDIEILSVCGGRFRMDGGTMFGLVPRPLWEPHARPDSLHRLLLACNCLLVREAHELTLVDTGIGDRFTDKQREIYAIEPGIDLPSSLALAGISPGEVTRVVFTHLHFDHFCGALNATGPTWEPAFPNAVHCVQEGEWRAALEGRSIMRTTYRVEELRFLQQQVRVDLLQGDSRITPHLSTFVTGGHTEHHQGIRIQVDDRILVYPADIMSTRAHVRPYWGTSYDMFPYQTLEFKQELVPRAAAEGWIVAWNHDPETVWSRLRSDGDRVLPADVEP